jgi:Dolichyl-phosphate-mannose-protein mannosyltransferase
LLAAALTAAAVILAVSGGFRTTVGGLRISARSPWPTVALGGLALGAWYVIARRERAVVADLSTAWQRCRRHSSIIVAIAVLSAMVAMASATHSAAGADASGYVSESAMFARGQLFHRDELSEVALGHDPYLTSPLGWRPADGGSQVPTYPPGLPLLMALPQALGGTTGASLVVILSGAVAVLATGLLASQLAGSIAGIIAAALLAFTPVFLYQSIQPMSDVPVTAAWMVCFALLMRRGGSSDLAAGVACALAVLIRPNLAPLAIVPLVLAQHRVVFATPVVIAGATLALLQWTWYGSPLRSGYGSADELFALSNAGANASRYFNWLIVTAPVLLLSILAVVRRHSDRTVRGLAAFAVLVIAAYLVYAVFEEWSYLRFLLPALAVMAVLTAAELAAWIDRWPVAVRPILLFIIVLGITAHALSVARSTGTFKLADQLRRVERVADLINEDVPPAAVLVAGEQSGSMRFYTERPILRWEAAAPASLAEVTATLEAARRPVYIVLDQWEESLFRARFAGVPAGALDWPPILDAGTSHRTRLWKLSDRDRFLQGEQLNTIRLP